MLLCSLASWMAGCCAYLDSEDGRSSSSSVSLEKSVQLCLGAYESEGVEL